MMYTLCKCMCTQEGNTALHQAAQQGHAEVCEVLLARCERHNEKNKVRIKVLAMLIVMTFTAVQRSVYTYHSLLCLAGKHKQRSHTSIVYYLYHFLLYCIHLRRYTLYRYHCV
jgi:Ankyrin repeat